MKELSKDIETIQVANLTTSGTSAHNGTPVDMEGAEGVRFIVPITSAAATSVVVAKAAEWASTSAFNALAATSAAITATTDTTGNNKVLIVDVRNPKDRYVQVQTTRATAAAVLGAIIAEKYGLKKLPPSQDSSVVAQTVSVSPST